MTMTETETKKTMELVSAHAYLMIAKRCVENTRIRPYIDEMMGKRLLEIYDALDKLLDELHEETYKEE